AAVAAQMAPVAMSEQTGGSILRPAAYCGVPGFKPSFGRVSRFGCYPFTWTQDHPGVIARSVEDIALVLSVVAGPDPLDPTTLDGADFESGQADEAGSGAWRRVGPGSLVPATYYLQALRLRGKVQAMMAAFFRDGGFDALLMPAAPGAAPMGLESTGTAALTIP